MLNKYCISIFLLLHLLFNQNLYGQKNYEDFAQKYKGMGSLSEMIMSHKCIIRKNFNLFYETTIKKSEEDRTLIWYKFVFHQPCFISFTIIPNNENDRYDLEVYKIKNNIKLCNTTVDSIFTKVDSLSKDVVYTDNFQSTSFRGSLFNSKQIEVTYNEAIYILVNNLSGPDLGHVIDLQTCDYSYVLKVNKEIIKTDAEDELEYLRKEFSAPLDRLKSIADKLCANSNDKKMGYSNFLGDAMATKNLNSNQVDSASKVQAKAIRKYDSLAGKPMPPIVLKKKENLVDKKINPKPTDSKVDSALSKLKQTKVTDSVETKKYIKEITETTKTTIDSLKNKFITKTDSVTETNTTTETEKKNTVIKTSFSYGKNYPSIFLKSDSIITTTQTTSQTTIDSSIVKSTLPKYNFTITDSIFEVISELKLNDGTSKNKAIKKTSPSKKAINVYFAVIDETTKKVIPHAALKFGKKTKAINDVLVYHDSISCYSAEFLNSNKWNLKCDQFGYLPFESYFNFDNCVLVDDQLYYLILVSPLKKEDKLALPNVYFQPNSTSLKQKSYKELDKLVEYLNSNSAKISINGHTQGKHFAENDSKALEEPFKLKGLSAKLSKKRAEIVYNYLIEKGIAKERLLIKGYAGRKPLIKHPKNKTEREINMRVEIKIIDSNEKERKETATVDSLANKTTENKLTAEIDSTLIKTYITETTETTITTIDSLKNKFLTKTDSFRETSTTTETEKKNTVIKTSFSYGKNYPSIFLKSDSIITTTQTSTQTTSQTTIDSSIVKSTLPKYNFIITDSIFEVISELKLNTETSKSKTIKKTRPPKKAITVYFTVIDETTKKVIPQAGLKFGKKPKTKNDLLVYHDSISCYSAEFLNSNKWILKCDLFGYLPFEEYFNFDNCIHVDDQLYYLILVSPLKKGDKLALPNVFFHPNSISLRQKSYKELDKLVEYLNSNPAKISINGHTQGNHFIDNTGKTVEEQFKFKGSSSKLSKKRAEIVYNYLIGKGIAKERLLIKGYAGRKPIVKHPKNKTERELNMRVEIKIIDINKKYTTTKSPEK
ncbi:MAG: OmpA family protein [Bacteroidia bacterium]|nr:OmpA family protein [Bacteroidia bacterium]